MTAHDAVQNEIKLLAEELGVKPYGSRFTEMVAKVTHAVEHALEVGDESFENVQRVIDREKRLANNPRRKPYETPSARRDRTVAMPEM